MIQCAIPVFWEGEGRSANYLNPRRSIAASAPPPRRRSLPPLSLSLSHLPLLSPSVVLPRRSSLLFSLFALSFPLSPPFESPIVSLGWRTNRLLLRVRLSSSSLSLLFLLSGTFPNTSLNLNFSNISLKLSSSYKLVPDLVIHMTMTVTLINLDTKFYNEDFLLILAIYV